MKKIFFILLVILFTSSSALAETKLSEIIIENNQRIESETIKSFLKINKGDSINSDLIDKSLQNIYATGLFSDVSFRQEGSKLIISVVESPIINEVAFEGNKRITNESLEKEVRLKPRSVYNKIDVQNDVKRIEDLYKASGRFSAKIEPKIINLENNRVNLVFEINEGNKTEVRGIFFIGNTNYSDSKLESVIQTKISRWYRFFTSDDSYDADRITYDQELLRRFYNTRGYADFKVNSVSAELTPENDAFFITFSVYEGVKYSFGKMIMENNLSGVDVEKLKPLLKTTEGEVYNGEIIEQSISELTRELGNYGYAFVDIDPILERNEAEKKIDIKYLIKEGPKVYVEKINIHGNVRTLDKVIRREFRVAEGDPYNAEKLRRTQQRIKNLGFFDKADIENQKGSAPDKVVVDVNVEERSTGELSLGAGFSTTDGALGEVSLSERNLLGTGKSLKLNTRVAQKRQEIDLGFTDPYFLDKNIAAGFDLFNIRRNRRTESSFDSDSKGFSLRASYPFTEHLTHSLKYTLKRDDVFSIRADASRFIKAEVGQRTTSMVGHSLLYDKTDDKFDPSEGFFARFNQDFAGIGGDNNFIRHEIKGGVFIPTISNEWVLKLSAKAGYLISIGDKDIDINNRFFIGGADLRGFRNDGIGPRDSTTKDALGGNIYYAGSVEYSFPLGLPEELGFSGSVFTDVGTLYKTDLKGSEIVDDSSLRASAGFGLSWKSPLGPVRIDIAQPFIKNDIDETQTLRFSFGTRF